MAYSDYIENKALNWLTGTAYGTAPTNLYFSLHSADPVDTGANEVTATYVSGRASYTASGFTSPATVGSNRQIKNTALVDFGNSILAGTIYWIGVWDASTSGNFLYGLQLQDASDVAAPLTFGSGDPVTIAINGVIVNLSITNFSIYFADVTLNWLKGTSAPTAPTNVYVGLFTLLIADGTGTEVTTTIRTAGRVAIASWAALVTDGTGRLLKNSALVDFGNSVGSVTGLYIIGLWDASTSGNLLTFGTFAPRNVIATEPVYFGSEFIKIKVS